MALTQSQRIEISKKIIELPSQNASLDNIKNTLGVQKVKLENEDNANKSLMDGITPIINAYQSEYTLLDGNVRVELLEQHLIDGANKVKQNYFFPNDNLVPLPSISDGVWKFLAPFSGSVAIGKKYTEDYDTTTKEADKIADINTQITIIEAIIDATRSTGLDCSEDTSGTCSDPLYTTQAECELNGETWTSSGGPDTYSPNATIQQALTDIVAAVNAWKTHLLSEKTAIQTANTIETDATKLSENNAAIADIDNAITIINGWLAYDDWDTTTVLPTGSGGTACAAFQAMTYLDFVSSKLRSVELQEIKDEITARNTFITTRTGQLSSYLGTVGQNLSTGELTGTGNGYYDNRFKVINIRLNLLGGSLNRLLSISNGQSAQDSIKVVNNNALDTYSSVMKVSQFRAEASGTGTIHVMSAADFSVGNSVYVVADDQEELTGTIVNISSNTIFLSFNVPEKYTKTNYSRIYKVL